MTSFPDFRTPNSVCCKTCFTTNTKVKWMNCYYWNAFKISWNAYISQSLKTGKPIYCALLKDSCPPYQHRILELWFDHHWHIARHRPHSLPKCYLRVIKYLAVFLMLVSTFLFHVNLLYNTTPRYLTFSECSNCVPPRLRLTFSSYMFLVKGTTIVFPGLIFSPLVYHALIFRYSLTPIRCRGIFLLSTPQYYLCSLLCIKPQTI